MVYRNYMLWRAWQIHLAIFRQQYHFEFDIMERLYWFKRVVRSKNRSKPNFMFPNQLIYLGFLRRWLIRQTALRETQALYSITPRICGLRVWKQWIRIWRTRWLFNTRIAWDYWNFGSHYVNEGWGRSSRKRNNFKRFYEASESKNYNSRFGWNVSRSRSEHRVH